MLNLHSDQHEWILQRERERLAVVLDEALLACWPKLAQQLGPRSSAFVRASLQSAADAGLDAQRHAVRLFNLWCIWGPNFEAKPGFEWAADILQDRQRAPNIRIQQLVLQSRARLQELNTQITVQDFDQNQAHLLALITHGAASSWIKQPEPDAEPTVLCDVDAIDIELAEQPWRQESDVQRTLAGDLVAIRQAPPSIKQLYRVQRAPAQRTPLSMAVLAAPISEGAKAILHVRSEAAHVCDSQIHPRMTWSHATGVEVTQGERTVRRLIHGAADPAKRLGAAAMGLVRSPVPTSLNLRIETCGLRLAGMPIGQQDLAIEVWPADQWLAEIRAFEQPEITWPLDARQPDARQPDLLLAVDGTPVSTDAWRQGWQKLMPALTQGLSNWARGIERLSSIERLRMTLNPSLMHGHGMFTWGMREEVSQEGSSAFLRFKSEGDWTACATNIHVAGDFKHQDAVTRIKLRSHGQAKMLLSAHRETAAQGLAQVLGEIKTTWRHPFEIEFESVACSSLKTMSLDVTESWGCLVGEAGLRARADGQGHEWFCQIKLEASRINYTLWDPILGPQRCTRELWPATTLLDWSAG